MAWRAVWVPYAALFTLPASLGVCAAYHHARGDARHARGYSFYAWTSLLSLPVGLVILVASPVVIATDPHDRKLLAWLTNFWLRQTTVPFFPVRTQGTEHLPPCDKAVVYVANHNSFLDIFSLSWLERREGSAMERLVPLKFLAKEAIFRIPWVGWLMSLTGQVRLNRKEQGSGRDVLAASREKLRQGVSVVVFAEGTRSRDGQVHDFKMGAFKLATEEGVPIVPITIMGTHELAGRAQMAVGTSIINADEFELNHGEACVTVHPAIQPAGYSMEALRDDTRRTIAAELEGLTGKPRG